MKNWILHEDNHLIIVNKPPKIPVQGDRTGDLSLIDYEYINRQKYSLKTEKMVAAEMKKSTFFIKETRNDH